MAKAKQSLEEGLDHSANKRGFTGKERHRYIGGALRNMSKRGKISLSPRGKSKSPHKASTSKPKSVHKPVVPKKHEPLPAHLRITLTAKLNSAASKGKPYNVYSIYKAGEKTPYNSKQFRKLSAARNEAKIEQDAHNQRYKRGMF